MKTILHLCADIGSDTKPYQDHPDYNVILIGKDVGVENYNPPEDVFGVVANPVCTEFSFAKWANNRGKGDHEKGMIIVKHCLRIIKKSKPKFWVIENPDSGKLKDFLGKPDFSYEPWQFGDPWTKGTALWGEFEEPEILFSKWEDVPKNEKLYIRPGRKKPGFAFLHKSAINHISSFECFKKSIHVDADFRSLCSQKFAKEFFKCNR